MHQYPETRPEEWVPELSDWAYEITGLRKMNHLGYLGQGITIAILDSGLHVDHPAFSNMNIIGWKDFIYHKERPYDVSGHGTHTTGVLAAQGYQKGALPLANYIICKVLDHTNDSRGSARDTHVAEAVRYSIQLGADIIVVSASSNLVRSAGNIDSGQAIRYAINKGVFLVCSAGNDGMDENDFDVGYPGTIPLTISVGSIKKNLSRSRFTSIGNTTGSVTNRLDVYDRFHPNMKPEFVAPGEGIITTHSDGRYRSVSGTSIAVPFTTAAIALIMEARRKFRSNGKNGGSARDIHELKELLMQTAKKSPFQSRPHDNYYGYGLIDPVAASGRTG